MSTLSFIGSAQARKRNTTYDIAVENGFVGTEQDYEIYCHGLTVAQVTLYQRSETAPSSYATAGGAIATYTFANGSVDFYPTVTPVGTENPHSEGWYELVSNAFVVTEDTTVVSGKTYYDRDTTSADWQTSPYTDTGDLYVIYASANSKDTFDIIQPTEWSTPAIMSEEAVSGDNGYTVCIVPIYKASSTQPTSAGMPTQNTKYTFASRTIEYLNNDWYLDAPDGDKVWMSTAVAISRDEFAWIDYDKWSTPTVWKEKGDNSVSYWLEKSATIITKDKNNSDSISPSSITVSAKKNVGGTTSAFETGTIKLYADGTEISPSSSTSSSITFSPTKYISTYVIKLFNGITELDTESIPVISTGKDATQYYSYIRYSPVASPTDSDWTVTPQSDTKYMGTYAGTTSISSLHASDFSWSKYVGDSATQYYTYVRYSANSDGHDYSTTANKYVGIYVGTESTPPAYNNAGWHWTQFKGDNSIVAVLTNDSAQVPADKDGNVSSFLTATTTIEVYEGGIKVTPSSYGQHEASTGCTIDDDDSDTINVTALTPDSATVTLYASYGGETYSKVFTITKQKQGIKGDTGGTGPKGADAKGIVLSSNVLIAETDMRSSETIPVIITVERQNIEGTTDSLTINGTTYSPTWDSGRKVGTYSFNISKNNHTEYTISFSATDTATGGLTYNKTLKITREDVTEYNKNFGAVGSLPSGIILNGDYFIASSNFGSGAYEKGKPYVRLNGTWTELSANTTDNVARLFNLVGNIMSSDIPIPVAAAHYAWFGNLIAQDAAIKKLASKNITLLSNGSIHSDYYNDDGTFNLTASVETDSSSLSVTIDVDEFLDELSNYVSDDAKVRTYKWQCDDSYDYWDKIDGNPMFSGRTETLEDHLGITFSGTIHRDDILTITVSHNTGSSSGFWLGADGNLKCSGIQVDNNSNGYVDLGSALFYPDDEQFAGFLPESPQGKTLFNAIVYQYGVTAPAVSDASSPRYSQWFPCEVVSSVSGASSARYIRQVRWYYKQGNVVLTNMWGVQFANSSKSEITALRAYRYETSQSDKSPFASTDIIKLKYGGNKLIFKDLPTVSAGLTSGMVWRDTSNSNVLKVIP